MGLERKLEWRINVITDGTSERLESEPESLVIRKMHGAWSWLKGGSLLLHKISSFLEKAWEIAVADPKKPIHGVKVGLAISLVSLFYYMHPLYVGVGGNAMWAVMTVVVVFESTVGATLCKCINRALGTFLAGSLGIGVHWIANHSGKYLEPLVLGTFVFLLASATTFSRFMPSVKARFDYGAMIFILTFSLVSVSGYRVDKLLELAWERLITIAIGASICIIISILFCPIWAGDELHQLLCQNLEKLAHSLDECAAEYFRDGKETSTACDEEAACSKRMLGYKCVLNSKATEELKANFGRWEPAHGRFNFRHPWKQYLNVGASLRSCAYCIETLNACANSETQAPPHLKRHLKSSCMRLSSSSSGVLKELNVTMKTMKQSSKINISVAEMNLAVQQLKNALIYLHNDDDDDDDDIVTYPSSGLEAPGDANSAETTTRIKASSSFMEILHIATLASLLIKNAAKIEGIVNEVNELATLAEFKPTTDDRQQPKKPTIASANKDLDETAETPSTV